MITAFCMALGFVASFLIIVFIHISNLQAKVRDLRFKVWEIEKSLHARSISDLINTKKDIL